MAVRGVRGAIDVSADEAEAILTATRTLLCAIREANPTMKLEDLASAVFTTTPDLHTAPPAIAARELGWTQVPLVCLQEMLLQGGPPHLIRVLVHWNTRLPQCAMRHVYLGRASSLRPDLDTQLPGDPPVVERIGRAGSLWQSLTLRFLTLGHTSRSGDSHVDCHENRRRPDADR